MYVDFPELILSLFAGGALALIYFGGLWWTVRALPRSRSPVLLFGLSLFLRVGLMFLVLCVALEGRWQRAVVGLVGFILVRIVLVSWNQSVKRPQA